MAWTTAHNITAFLNGHPEYKLYNKYLTGGRGAELRVEAERSAGSGGGAAGSGGGGGAGRAATGLGGAEQGFGTGACGSGAGTLFFSLHVRLTGSI